MIEKKGIGGKRVCRVGVNLTNQYHNKLSKLATSCNMSKTTLAALILERCLDDPVMVDKLQKEFNVHPVYKIMPFRKDGNVDYMFRG